MEYDQKTSDKEPGHETASTAADETIINAALVLRIDLDDFANLKRYILNNLGADILFQRKALQGTKLWIVEREP